MPSPETIAEWLPPYEGSDIIGYILRDAMRLQGEPHAIQSITKVRDFAIIVTDCAVYRVKPYDRTGWAVETIAIL